ncbi:MAG: 2-amino-4-hydroxy-6-hydroxymethyldihydropteridine diphosphokinase [Bacillota bacterium]
MSDMPANPVTVYIALGSNQGDKIANIRQAVQLLNAHPAVQVHRVAPLYASAPVGYTEQDWFVNTVLEATTSLLPQELLAVTRQIEHRLGRVRTVRWGPRTIDLDILLYGSTHIDTPELQIPHPRMGERAFVMVPLADLAPRLLVQGQEAAQLARKLGEEQQIQRL